MFLLVKMITCLWQVPS